MSVNHSPIPPGNVDNLINYHRQQIAQQTPDKLRTAVTTQKNTVTQTNEKMELLPGEVVSDAIKQEENATTANSSSAPPPLPDRNSPLAKELEQQTKLYETVQSSHSENNAFSPQSSDSGNRQPAESSKNLIESTTTNSEFVTMERRNTSKKSENPADPLKKLADNIEEAERKNSFKEKYKTTISEQA